MIPIYAKYLLMLLILASVSLLLPQAVAIKLSIILILCISAKILLFEYIDLYQIYRKAKETATGAGMLFIGISLIISALISSGV